MTCNNDLLTCLETLHCLYHLLLTNAEFHFPFVRLALLHNEDEMSPLGIGQYRLYRYKDSVLRFL